MIHVPWSAKLRSWPPYPTAVNLVALFSVPSDFIRSRRPAVGRYAGVRPLIGFENDVYCESKVTETVDLPMSQWAAVRKTVGEISVPEQYGNVPLENVPTSAPTSGCRLPSSWP